MHTERERRRDRGRREREREKEREDEKEEQEQELNGLLIHLLYHLKQVSSYLYSALPATLTSCA
jgi:hypothetical protein